MNFCNKCMLNHYLVMSLLVSLTASIASGEKLRGVTLEVAPYVSIVDNTFRGYCVDLMNEISNVIGVGYSLYLAPDKQYGLVTPYDRVTGMIGEVYNRAADFAIADLTVTDDRKRYVKFTEPFMKFGLSALIHKSNIGDMVSFEDLADQTAIKYGTYQSGRTISSFYSSPNETISKMYLFIMKNRSHTLVANASEAVRLVRTSKFAFIQEAPANEYIAAHDCDLTVINDVRGYFLREYAIAMELRSPYLAKFNYALAKLRANGTLAKLRDKYWTGSCNGGLYGVGGRGLSLVSIVLLVMALRAIVL